MLSSTRVKLLIFFYLLSGTSSLAYEVLWARMLSIQFGVSIFGVVITVSAFMFGLGIGSLLGNKFQFGIKRMLLILAIFEASIAIWSLALPVLFSGFDNYVSDVVNHWGIGAWYLLQFALVIGLLLLPAMLMGIGFPIILQVLRHSKGTLARVYGLNALGAACGAILPLVLLPNFGWLGAMQIVAGISLVVAAGILYVMRDVDSALPIENSQSPPYIQIPGSTYLLYTLIGTAAIILEIGWTRLFGMILLRTEYVLAIILAIYIGGIGLGSLLASKLRHERWYTILPVMAGIFVILSLWQIPVIALYVNNNGNASLFSVMMWQGGAIALLTLPVTLVLGAWLPLLTRKLGDRQGQGASLYGVNSIGAGAGALIGGFLLIPQIGSNATIIFSAMLLCICGLYWSTRKIAWVAVPILVIIALPVKNMPPVAQLKPHLYANSQDIFHFEDAISITHVVERKDGQRILLSDLQRMDASSDPTSIEVQKNQARLPLLFHSNPNSVLFLGLGTGISAAGSLAFPGLKRTAVELSKGAVIAANSWFSEVNDNISKYTKIVRDDARRYLMRSNDNFDVIVGDLFHPDMVGRSTLLSIQQFRRTKSHLTENGLFVQWLALNQFDIQSFEVVLRSFNEVFPHSVVFVDAFRVALVGPKTEFDPSVSIFNNLQRMSDTQQEQASGGEGPWTWLGRYWGHIEVGDGVRQDEWAPQIEYSLPIARYNGQLDLVKLLSYLLKKRVHVKDAMLQLNIAQNDKEKFERAFIGTDLAHRSWVAFLTKQNQLGQRDLQLAYQANPKDRWIGFAVADGVMASLSEQRDATDIKRILDSVLKVRPDHPDALRRMWRLEAKNGNEKQAAIYKNRLAAISPFDRDLATE